MRVLVFTNVFPSSRHPTRGIYTYHRIDALAKHCDVEVVCPVNFRSCADNVRDLTLTATEQHGRLRSTYVPFVPVGRVAPALNTRLLYWSTRRVVGQIRRRFPFDIVLGIWGYPDAGAALLHADDQLCPQVTQLIGSDLNILGRSPKFRPFVAETLRASSHVITMSRSMADGVTSMGVPPDRITVRFNGVDQDKFRVRDARQVRAKLGLPPDCPLVLFVGNLTAVKGPEILLEAFSSIATLPSRPTLLFVGAGDMRSELERAAAARGLGAVRFVGKKPHEEIPDWISAADILCLPSRAEGCPNVVLEALASGRPVVATAVGAVPDLVTSHQGVVVPPDDVTALTAALRDALGARWDADAIRRSVAGMSWDAVGRDYYEILRASLRAWRGSDALAERRAVA
jgi:glycosyltransferase involved in cell wall biosynthesis